MGTPRIAVPALEALVAAGHQVATVVAQPDRPAGRGRRVEPPATKVAALRLGVPVFQPEKVRASETRLVLQNLKPELIVVVAYGRILPWELLAIPPRGCLNVHMSLLPRYRGAAPVQWALARGERETGVTTMLMEEGLDTGPILLQRRVSIESAETAVELSDRLSAAGAALLVETLEQLDSITPVPQDSTEATYAPVLTREDGQVDWTLDASSIVNRSRGFHPWPGTWTTLHGRLVHFWGVEAAAGSGPTEPGVISRIGADGLEIGCGDNTRVLVREMQLEGKRRMTARDFANGAHLHAGMRFGDEA